MRYEKELERFGLSDKEAKTYLAVLELGSASAQEIAHRAGLKRPTAYFAMEKLSQLGLMSTFQRGKKQYFAAESPERLISLITERKKKTQALEEEMREIVPDLNNLFHLAGEKPRVHFFEGKDGIKAIQNDILKSKAKNIEEIYPKDEFVKLFSAEERKEYITKRKLKKIKIRAIYSSTERIALAKDPFVKTKHLASGKFPISADIVIYGDKIAIATYKGKLMGAIIESKEIAETLRLIFNLAWSVL